MNFILAAAAPPAAVRKSVETVGDWLKLGVNIAGVKVTIGEVLLAGVVLVAFIFGSALLERLLHRYAKRNAHVNQSTIYTVERLLHYMLLTVGVLIALNTVGIPMAKLTVFAGALGVGLGFGLQDMFKNFISGLILLFDRSLKVGDFVELASGVHGTVRDIFIRATRVSTNDDIDILVPNSEFVNGQVTNWTLREVARRQKVDFGVAYGSNKELVKKAALEAAAEVPFTLGLDGGARAPQVWLTGFGDSSLDFKLVVWLNADAVRRPAAVTAAYYWALHTALEKYEIEIPFPQRDLRIKEWVRPRNADKEAAAAPEKPRTPAPAGEAPTNDAARDVARDIAEEAAARKAAAERAEAEQAAEVAEHDGRELPKAPE